MNRSKMQQICFLFILLHHKMGRPKGSKNKTKASIAPVIVSDEGSEITTALTISSLAGGSFQDFECEHSPIELPRFSVDTSEFYREPSITQQQAFNQMVFKWMQERENQ